MLKEYKHERRYYGFTVGKYVKIEGQSSSVGKAGEVKQEKINSVFGGQETETKDDSYQKFEALIKDSPVKNEFLNEKDLLARGFRPKPGIKLVKDKDGNLTGVEDKDSPLMDKNGGHYYINDKTGEEIRICDFERSNTYKKGNIEQEQWFDNKGKPSGGRVTEKQADGTLKIYEYGIDYRGNKFIKSIKTELPAND